MNDVYFPYECRKILVHKIIDDFEYYIISLGRYPCAYVKMPCKLKDKEVWSISCHGGITYCENYLYIDKNEKIEGHFVGWDYAHYNDYICIPTELVKRYQLEGLIDKSDKKWTLEEIETECKSVIGQIKKLMQKAE